MTTAFLDFLGWNGLTAAEQAAALAGAGPQAGHGLPAKAHPGRGRRRPPRLPAPVVPGWRPLASALAGVGRDRQGPSGALPASADRPAPRPHPGVRSPAGRAAVRRRTQRRRAAHDDDRTCVAARSTGRVHGRGRRVTAGEDALRPSPRGRVHLAQRRRIYAKCLDGGAALVAGASRQRSDTSTPTPRRMSLLRTSIPDVCNAIPEHPSQPRCQCLVVTHALSYSAWRRCGSCRGIGHSSRARWRSGAPIVANHSPERHLGVDRQAERAWLAMQASSDTACWSASTPLGRGRGQCWWTWTSQSSGAVPQFP
jgi:hypothetical protein